MLNQSQLQNAVSAAQQRFALIQQKYPNLKAYLVLSSPIGQTKIENTPVQILSEFPGLIIDDKFKAGVLRLLELMESKEKDDPKRKRLQKQTEQIAGKLKFNCDETCQVEIRFHDLNYDLIWQLQADELVDQSLTPQTKASIRIVLGTLINFAGRGDIKSDLAASALSISSTALYKDYSLPHLELLTLTDVKQPTDKWSALLTTQNSIIKTLATFGIQVTAGDITQGPAFTRFEFSPSEGLRVSRIANLEADIARATKSERINILAPIPGKDSVGIELPNSHKLAVPIRELLENDAFQNGEAKIPIALGKDVYGKAIIGDLASMPHLLVAGATGSGKSVCINSIVTSLLYRFTPDEMRVIMIDPRDVEMQGYKHLPHLALPVVTDPKQSLRTLRWVVNEMKMRCQIFAKEGCRNFNDFNSRSTRKIPSYSTTEISDANKAAQPPAQTKLEIPDSYPYLVVIVNELADLMQAAPAEIEINIARIGQKGRAAGIHLILATQTPCADVVTGFIKASIPCRIALQVSCALDSRVILDRKGADKLMGKGDMLYLPPGTSQLVRVQGTMVTDEEIQGLVEHCCKLGEPKFEATLDERSGGNDEGDDDWISRMIRPS